MQKQMTLTRFFCGVFLLLLTASVLKAQQADSVVRRVALDEVVVRADRLDKETIPVQVLRGEALRKLSTHSVADAVRYFSGISKSTPVFLRELLIHQVPSSARERFSFVNKRMSL